MKNIKKFGAVIIVLIVLTSLVQVGTGLTSATDTTKEKFFAFLTDVIGIDLTKYNITKEGYGTSYPEEYDGQVKQEHITVTLESSNGSQIPVAAVFDNGFISWLHLYPINGSIIYSIQPSNDALVESRNIFEKYQVFCRKFNINDSHITTLLNISSKAPASPPAKVTSSNFNKISDFTPANITSENVKLGISQTSIGLCYTIEGVDVPNKSVGLDFSYNTFVFSDTWNLYGIGSLNMISEQEATNLMFEAAKKYCETLKVGTSHGPASIKPVWSERRDVGFNMIPGQLHNNSAYNTTNFIKLGNVTRHPLMLYPMWQAIFYFKHSISGIVGIQVILWGDTKEIAYCGTYGYLGNSGQISTDETEQTQTPSADNSEQAPNTQTSLIPPEIIACTVLAAAGIIAAIAVFWKKKHT